MCVFERYTVQSGGPVCNALVRYDLQDDLADYEGQCQRSSDSPTGGDVGNGLLAMVPTSFAGVIVLQ